MSFPRAAGILLHPTSLPSRGGIGDFGPAAYQFVDALAAARQGLWQVLPLGPLGHGNSPYSSTSAFAGNPLLISLERLASHGWIDQEKISHLATESGPVAYDRIFATKMPLLFEAGRGFVASASAGARERFERFCWENAWWLDDFVLFDAVRARQKLASWNEWPAELAHREASALQRARKELADDLKVRSALQFAFYEQWQALRRYCSEHKIRVVGDVAIFVNYDSADVWMHRDLFRLNENLESEVVSGVPTSGSALREIPTTSGSIISADSISSGRFQRPIRRRSTAGGWMVRGTIYFTSCAKLSADCRFSPKILATSRPQCMPCASGCRFRGWRYCSLVSATKARTCICRIAPPARSSTRERTTMTPRLAGLSPALPITNAATRNAILAAVTTEFIGRSSVPRKTRWPILRSSPCRTSSGWAAKRA